jgi:hypothetical protein
MHAPLSQEPGFQHRSFHKNCSYCGARLEVFVSCEAGSGEKQDYACPECGKAYSTPAALEPLVSVLTPRSDGKSGPYQDTMF